jgi:hypothetical protein
MTRFSTLNPDGTETNVRDINQRDLLACPHAILVADHYREDGTCRCDDPENAEMAEWGYTWKDGQWT